MSYDHVSRRHFFFGALLAGAVPVPEVTAACLHSGRLATSPSTTS